EHTCKSLLGLTMNCARCHDHMSDPVEQSEYYAVRAIFEPHQVRLDRLPGAADVAIDGLPRVFDKDLSAATYLYVRGDERTPREAVDPLRQEFVVQDDLAAAEQTAKEAEKKLGELRGKPDPAKNGYDVQVAEQNATTARLRFETLQAVTQVERREADGDTKSA